MKTVQDKNGREVAVGDDVQVGDPGPSDMHQHAFLGHVIDVYPDREEVCVVDQEENCFDVANSNVEVVG